MDKETITLLILLIAAFFWWFKMQMDDNRRLIKEFRRQDAEKKAQAERIRKLTNK